jgi:hypothetical protein
MNLCATPEWKACSSYICEQMLLPDNTDMNPKNYLNCYNYNREGNLKFEKER